MSVESVRNRDKLSDIGHSDRLFRSVTGSIIGNPNHDGFRTPVCSCPLAKQFLGQGSPNAPAMDMSQKDIIRERHTLRAGGSGWFQGMVMVGLGSWWSPRSGFGVDPNSSIHRTSCRADSMNLGNPRVTMSSVPGMSELILEDQKVCVAR